LDQHVALWKQCLDLTDNSQLVSCLDTRNKQLAACYSTC
jgi:hypothetical protein